MADQGSEQASGRGFRWWWVVFGAALLALGLSGVLLMTSQPDQSTEGQVRRLLNRAASQESPGLLTGLVRLLTPARGQERVDAAKELAGFGEPAIPALLNGLSHHRNGAARVAAADALGGIGAPACFAALTNAVASDRDFLVQNAALQAIGKLDDPRVTPALLGLLKQPRDGYQRREVVLLLNNRMEPKVIQGLIELLRSPVDGLPAVAPNALTDGRVYLGALAAAKNSDGRTSAAVALLKTGQPVAVEAALQFIEQAAGRGALGEVLEELSNSDWHPNDPEMLRRLLAAAQKDTKADSAEGLARLLAGSVLPEAADALAVLLKEHPAVDVREAAADALSRISGERSTVALVRALHDDAAAKVRRAAARALARLGNEAALQALRQALDKEARPEVRAEVLEALRNRGIPEVVPLILELLHSGKADDGTRQMLAESLQHSPSPEAQEALVTLLTRNPAPKLRATAARALGSFRSDGATKALLAALRRERDAEVVSALISALEELHDPQAVEPLCVLLSTSPDDWLRRQAAEALGRLGDRRALQPLVKALGSKHEPWVNIDETVIEALGELGDPHAIPVLLQSLKRGDTSLRDKCATALGRLHATEAVDALIELAVKRQNKNALEALGAVGDQRALPVLLNAFKSANPALRSGAAAALGRLGHRDAVTLLAQGLATEKSDSVRGVIVSALGELGDPRALPALRGALTAKGASYREQLAWALGHCGDATVVPDLQTLLDDPEERVRFAAAMGLAEIGDAASAQALRAKLTDAEENTRIAAAFALAFLDAKEGMPVLAPNVHSKTHWQRFATVVAMLRLGTPEAREVLAKGAQDVLPGLAAIARRGREGQRVEALLPALTDPNRDVRQYTARALAFFRDPSARPALQQAAKDRNEEVRAAAQSTLARLSRL